MTGKGLIVKDQVLQFTSLKSHQDNSMHRIDWGDNLFCTACQFQTLDGMGANTLEAFVSLILLYGEKSFDCWSRNIVTSVLTGFFYDWSLVEKIASTTYPPDSSKSMANPQAPLPIQLLQDYA